MSIGRPNMQTFEQKMREQRNSLSTPMECEQCGATHFYDTHVFQYSRGGYGTVEFRQLSSIPVPVKICIGCGLPVPPQASGGKMHPASTNEFQASVRAGQEWRDKQKTNANAVASKRELDELTARVEELTAGSGLPLPEGKTALGREKPGREKEEEKEPVIATVLDVPDAVTAPVQFAEEPATPTLSALMQKRTGRQGPGNRQATPKRSK